MKIKSNGDTTLWRLPITITIPDPEVGAVIWQRLESGAFADAEDVVRRTLAVASPAIRVDALPQEDPAMTIDDLFAPLRGLDLDFGRNPSTGRPIDL
jgi:hypothetical protein